MLGLDTARVKQVNARHFHGSAKTVVEPLLKENNAKGKCTAGVNVRPGPDQGRARA